MVNFRMHARSAFFLLNGHELKAYGWGDFECLLREGQSAVVGVDLKDRNVIRILIGYEQELASGVDFEIARGFAFGGKVKSRC